MKITTYTKKALISMLLLCTAAGASMAQQWNGPDNPEGNIWRSGKVAIGSEPANRNDIDALLDIKRPLSGSANDLLFSAKSTYKDQASTVFEIDTKRVYVGGVGAAAKKSSFLPEGVFDFATNRGAVIGLNRIDKTLPRDYTLAVGGKILAEEVRVMQIKNWADYVFRPDYPLLALLDVEDYIGAHHRLPGIPTASEVEKNGISLGDMQAKLLLKIEELTLHLIEQHKTIEALQSRLAKLEHGDGTKLVVSAGGKPGNIGEGTRP